MDLQPKLRRARRDEIGAIDALMKASRGDLFPHFNDAEQAAASVEYIAAVDPTLISDGTYYVVEVDGGLVACGATSRLEQRGQHGPRHDPGDLVWTGSDNARGG